MALNELSALKELSAKLTTSDIVQLKLLIEIPEGLCENISEGIHFLSAIKRWKEHNPCIFHQALEDIRPDLVAQACSIKWLCVSSPYEYEHYQKELSVKTLVELLKSEITQSEWLMIYMSVSEEIEDKAGFEITLSKLLEEGLIGRDLNNLRDILERIERIDVIKKLEPYEKMLCEMEEGELESKLKKEISKQAREMKEWELKLKEFAKSQNKKVKQMSGDDETVNLEQVFLELTILKQKPKEINLEDETTYNEIAYLRKIANKEVKITPVDFTNELITYEPKKAEIWCLIGNPGCGKTFLAKRTALRFSSNELVGIQYTISVPCRNTDWHAMESTRYEEDRKMESEFIQQWLCLGLPVGPSWTVDLAKHLNESSGEGLLLIIDGLDEFTRKVPFGKTFLGLLLTRQSLTKSTIILTSRPGAWTDISTNHELKIDRHYQVLGFSPENRDLYFKKQITNVAKLKACLELMERHDEMKQLSLIPVNASLFAALLKGEYSASINTLTRLYSELTLYLIRIEVSRMGLHEFSRVAALSDLHPDIQACLKRIGFIAFLGVANRDLVSEENVPLVMGQEEYPSHCLGLAHEHYKKEAVGLVKKVWTFAHLTMQEFTAAHWLSNHSWTKQCLSIRYISDSTANFSLFRMLVRFLCGLLSDRAAAVLSVMYRYLTPQPMPMIGIPLTCQLINRFHTCIFDYTGLTEFTKIFIQLNSILFETDSVSVANRFAHFSQFLPFPLYLYFTEVSPNEWFCFLESLKHISQIQFIHIPTETINPVNIKSLLKEMRICFVKYFAISFQYPTTINTVLECTNLIRDTEFRFDTNILINLTNRSMSGPTAVKLFSPTTNQKLSCIILTNISISNEFLRALSNQLTSLDCLVLPNVYDPNNYAILLPTLCLATQLRVLHLNCFPEEYDLYLRAMLPNFSNLQEIQLDDYSQLTALPKLSSLTYLQIGIGDQSALQMEEPDSSNLYINLLQLFINNRRTLKAVTLYELDCSGFSSCITFLNMLSLCTKVVELNLESIFLPADDPSEWSILGNSLKLLVVLTLEHVFLYDTGFKSLCAGLAYHPNIRELMVTDADITSLSCIPLIQLIPTVTQLEKLSVPDLSRPKHNKKSYKLLQQTADEYRISL